MIPAESSPEGVTGLFRTDDRVRPADPPLPWVARWLWPAGLTGPGAELPRIRAPHGEADRTPSTLPEGRAPAGRVLDFACGGGCHTRLALQRGFSVLAVDLHPDIDWIALAPEEATRLEVRIEDLEQGAWSFADESFAVVVVTRFLHRPRLDLIPDLLAPGGVLIYETFAQGHEQIGRPRRPEFLLAPDELPDRLRRAGLHCVAFEQGLDQQRGAPAVVQRVVAMRPPAWPGALR